MQIVNLPASKSTTNINQYYPMIFPKNVFDFAMLRKLKTYGDDKKKARCLIEYINRLICVFLNNEIIYW